MSNERDKIPLGDEEEILQAFWELVDRAIEKFGDSLSYDERIRLEALAQAVANSTTFNTDPESIIADAEEFEDYIRGTDPNVRIQEKASRPKRKKDD